MHTVRLSSNVNFILVDIEGINEILVESDELEAQLNFVSNVWHALRIARADWLFDPEHVREVLKISIRSSFISCKAHSQSMSMSFVLA